MNSLKIHLDGQELHYRHAQGPGNRVTAIGARMVKARNNPFRCDRLQALSYEGLNGGMASLLARLQDLNYTGAAIGSKGSGKTTLLCDLKVALKPLGIPVVSVFANDHHPLTAVRQKELLQGLRPDHLVLLDAAGGLTSLAYHRLQRKIRNRARGLVMTSHRRILSVPVLIECKTTPELFQSLINHLLPTGQGIAPAKIKGLFDEHRGNLRDCFWALYDLYPSLKTIASEI